MTPPESSPHATKLADELRGAREMLVKRWLDRIAERMAVHENDVFPTDELLDHVPLLIDGIADYLEDPADEITADIPVVAKAMELGELRHQQQFEAPQILREYEILGGILFQFLGEVVGRMEETPAADELLVCARRLFRAVSVIQQVTTSHFLRLADERVHKREEQLRSFNRAVSHEMKNRINTIRGATEMLREEWVAEDPKQRERFVDIIGRSTEAMQGVISSLIELSRLDSATTQPRNVLLRSAATEVARQLREFAEARSVQIRISDDLPEVEVPAAAVELCLSNYVSNAVKYRDPAKPERWVHVEGRVTVDTHGAEGVSQVVVRVRDNGLGVPPKAREKLFQRFFRAHAETVTGEEGTGLGLAIVRETVEAVGGRAWAEFGAGSESCFLISVPLPRDTPEPAEGEEREALQTA